MLARILSLVVVKYIQFELAISTVVGSEEYAPAQPSWLRYNMRDVETEDAAKRDEVVMYPKFRWAASSAWASALIYI